MGRIDAAFLAGELHGWSLACHRCALGKLVDLICRQLLIGCIGAVFLAGTGHPCPHSHRLARPSF